MSRAFKLESRSNYTHYIPLKNIKLWATPRTTGTQLYRQFNNVCINLKMTTKWFDSGEMVMLRGLNAEKP